MQVVALGAGHTHCVALNGGLHLELAFFDQLLDLLGQLGLDAVAHLDDLLDLVAPHFLHRALVQKAHVYIALGEFVAQDFLDLLKLKIRIAEQGDFLVLELDAGRGPLEVEARADLLGGVVDGIFHFDEIGFANRIKRWHVSFLFNSARSSSATI